MRNDYINVRIKTENGIKSIRGGEMRSFNFEKEYKKMLTSDIVLYLTRIHEYRGMYAKGRIQDEMLSELVEIARIQSTEASNRIEGIITTDERLRKIVHEKTIPKTRNEKEIAGYRDVLATIHESYDYIPITSNMILQLHRDLYKFSGNGHGGSFKSTDNVIAEKLPDGTKKVRFQPVPAWETSESIDNLCNTFKEALSLQTMDVLLLLPMFILDFLCIHPFDDGNGRMSRLLTLLILYRSGYFVGQYISIEKLISDTKEDYYEVLQASSWGWHEEKNDYAPFVRYMLGIVIAAYREFGDRVELLTDKTISKSDRITEIIKKSYGKITKSEIAKQCPEISQTTIQRALNELVKSSQIIKIGGGRYTSYVWNRENE